MGDTQRPGKVTIGGMSKILMDPLEHSKFLLRWLQIHSFGNPCCRPNFHGILLHTISLCLLYKDL